MTLQLTAETWDEIERLTRERCAERNADMKERHGIDDEFLFHRDTSSRHQLDIIKVSHISGKGKFRRAISSNYFARHKDTGAIWKGRGNLKGVKFTLAPKALHKLNGKSAEEITKGLNLTGFMVVLGASVTSVRSL